MQAAQDLAAQKQKELLDKERWKAAEILRKRDIKYRLDQDFTNGFDMFVRGSLMGLGISGKGIQKTLAGELFRKKKPIWLAKYKLR